MTHNVFFQDIKKGCFKLPLSFFTAANMYAVSQEATSHLVNFHQMQSLSEIMIVLVD